MRPPNIKKLYYSISEVSEMTSLKPYVLRYWETEFPQLRPSKNRAGNRIYRSNDIKIVLSIKKLLYSDKYTIEGAKQRLQEELKDAKSRGGNRQLDLLSRNGGDSETAAVIEEIRQELKKILDVLDSRQ